jgi:hypothetical protein
MPEGLAAVPTPAPDDPARAAAVFSAAPVRFPGHRADGSQARFFHLSATADDTGPRHTHQGEAMWWRGVAPCLCA